MCENEDVISVSSLLCGVRALFADRVWMINGSLLSFDKFFADIKHLSQCLPVPHTAQRYGSSTGYTALHALVATSPHLPRPVVHRLAKKFLTRKNVDYNSRCSVLKPDVTGRTPVYLALHSGDVELAIQLLQMLEDSTVDQVSKARCASTVKVNTGKIGSLYMSYAADNVARLEKELQETLEGSFIRGRSGSLLYLLSLNLDRVEMLWRHLINKCNIGALARMMYDPAGQIVDCFQKAKHVMLLLNIPFSQISEKNTHYYAREDNPKQVDAPSANGSNKENHQESSYFANCKDITPGKLKKLVPWKVATDITKSLAEWAIHHMRAQSDSTHKSTRGQHPSFCDVMREEGRYGASYGSVTEHFMYDAARAKLEASVLLHKATDISLVTFGTDMGIAGDDRECKPSRRQGRDSTIWGSSVPPLLLAETRRHRGKGVESVHNMARLLSTFKNNTDIINDALKCAMTVLEFARSLCNARVLVSLSHEPFPSPIPPASLPSRSLPALGSRQHVTAGLTPERFDDASALQLHPIDMRRAQLKHARKYSADLFRALSTYGASNEAIDASLHLELLSVGASALLNREGDVSQSTIADFMSIGTEVSPTFSVLRSVILKAISIVVDIKNVQSNAVDSDVCLTTTLVRRYMRSSSYDEERIMTGEYTVNCSGDDSDDTTPLSSEEFHLMIQSIASILRNIRACDVAFMSMTHSRKGAAPSPHSALTSLMTSLCDHVISYPQVFSQDPLVVLLKSTMSKNDTEDFILLRHCPSSYERKDLLKLVTYSSAHNKGGIAASTSDLVERHMVALRTAYGAARKLIDVVLRVMGVFAMAHVYRTDYLNWRGMADCNPYMALSNIYKAPMGGSETSRLHVDRHLESDLISCVQTLKLCRADKKYEISNPIPVVLASSTLFAVYSPMDFFITVTALQGRCQLLEVALTTLVTATSKCSPVDNICLVWLVAMQCPPAPSSPVYTQYGQADVEDETHSPFPTPSSSSMDMRGYHAAYESTIMLLLSHGYAPTAPPRASLSVLDIASLKGMATVVECLLNTQNVDHFFRPLCSLSSVHFMLLSDRMTSDMLDQVLSLCGETSSATAIVDFSSFLTDVNNDVELMSGTMSDLSHTAKLHHATTSSGALHAEDVIRNDINSLMGWTPLWAVVHAFSALQGLVPRRPKVASPLFNLFTTYLKEVRSLAEFDPSYVFKDYHQNDLMWTTLHVAMMSKVGSKFVCLWNHLREGNVDVSGIDMSRNGTMNMVPLDLLHYACFYNMPAAMMCLEGHSSYPEMNESVFFSPLNSSVTPLEVALRVGSRQCVERLLKHELKAADQDSYISCSLLMTCVSTGSGGEMVAMALLNALLEMDRRSEGGGEGAGSVSKRFLSVLSSPVENRSRFGIEGETVLHACARRNYSLVCSRLLGLGVSSSLHDGTGMKSIQISIALGHTATTRVFGKYCCNESRAASVIAFVCRRYFFLRKCREKTLNLVDVRRAMSS